MKLSTNTHQTMSSREIAELTSKHHKNVKRDIEKMLNELDIDRLSIERIYLDSMNRKQSEYNLNRDLTDCLLTGYSAKARMAVIKRWRELESKEQPPAIPQTYAEALQLAADQAKQLEEAKPKLEYHDKVLATENGITTTEIASELGMTANKLNKLLEAMKVQRKIGRRWVLTAANIGKGYDVETTHVDDGGVSRHAMKWSEKGRKFIHELICQ